jgi:hypothetical protein
MPDRFVFRQVDYRDIPTFLADGEIRAKNHASPQACYQTSYQNLVNRRGTDMFQVPGGGVVNDFVAFYFSPLTSFTFAIHNGGVKVLDPAGNFIGQSSRDDRVFVVCKVSDLFNAGLNCCYSDFALNSDVPSPTVIADHNNIENHVQWSVFDDYPMTASIPEIGYGGVCKFFGNKVPPLKYQFRRQQRMAEFLAHTSVPLSQIACIVTPTDGMNDHLQTMMDTSAWGIPILTKPGCFVQ